MNCGYVAAYLCLAQGSAGAGGIEQQHEEQDRALPSNSGRR